MCKPFFNSMFPLVLILPSVSMACKSLARLCHGAPLDEGYMQVTPPVVHTLIPICKIGHDGE